MGQLGHRINHNIVVAGREMCSWEVPTPILQLKVRRTALLEDTFRQLDHADHDNFKKTLVVRRIKLSDNLIWLSSYDKFFFFFAD